jgi:hypothetical protein
MLILRAASRCSLPTDGALTLDDFAHPFELAGMCVTPSLVAQPLAFFVIDLLELDALAIRIGTIRP